jgi:hypothetical protein
MNFDRFVLLIDELGPKEIWGQSYFARFQRFTTKLKAYFTALDVIILTIGWQLDLEGGVVKAAMGHG